ncbi:MAG: trypsin-like serine protease [Candidatus Dojkabacteria bacterium]|nr:trypsin-like serine protease [Candidatus Dojkabacteria bacterium]MDQ7021811.1 trypsin-like serine protease [Candidatus Dojkabacteria bacterium]
MKILRTYIALFIIAAFAVMVVFTSDILKNDNQSSEDSSALYGGRLEAGYPSGGYLVSENSEGKYNYCSIVTIERGKAITAAHCVEDTVALEIGFNSFVFEGDNNLQVTRVYRSRDWDGKNLNADFAIIEFNLNNELSRPIAQITSPTENCNYTVVAYGRTEEDEAGQLETRPRKSGKVCIKEVDAGTFVLEGFDSGICIGDSGSPIYESNTDILVGIASSILTSPEQKNDPCFIGNTAVAVRADINYTEFSSIDSNTLTGEFSSQDITEASGLFEDFIAATGTEDLFSERRNVIIFIAGIFGVFTLIMLLTQFLNKRR